MADSVLILLFLLWVNGLPPFVAILLHNRYARPIDGNRAFKDGLPLLGPNKTIRGLLVAVVGGALFAPLLGISLPAGAVAGLLAMAGDLLTSFVKRRKALESGNRAMVLDQLLEALFPLIFFHFHLHLGIPQLLTTLVLFTLTASLSSHLWTIMTERAFPARYPRVVTSTARFREWRSCHRHLARYQVWFNLTSFLSEQVLLTWAFKLTGLYRIGYQNAQIITRTDLKYTFADLPPAFDGLTILFLADLHLDGLPGIDSILTRTIANIKPDLCLVGGDLRMKTYGDSTPAIQRLAKLMDHIHPSIGSFGVLGNHDCIEMLPELEDCRLVMLVNDAIAFERGGDRLWLAGTDDPHYYRLADADRATREIPPGEFTIYLAHSPEHYREAEQHHAHLYLCGHTHGGQVCLKEGVPIITNSRAPRFTASGAWRYGRMQGYTSRGVAPSSIPVRFNCPGEVVVITLHSRRPPRGARKG